VARPRLNLDPSPRQEFTAVRSAARRVGTICVNRSMIGAVVDVQPVWDEELSCTGPKAGGPHYRLRFATQRAVTVKTAALTGIG